MTDYTGYMAIVNMYDGLTTVNAKGEIVPHLAKSWDISPDGLTYTFHLRDDAKFTGWHGGKGCRSLPGRSSVCSASTRARRTSSSACWKAENVTAPDDATLVMKIEAFSPFMAATP